MIGTSAPVCEGRTLALSGTMGDFLAMQATVGAPDGYAPIMVFRTSVMSGGGVSLDYVCEHTGPWESVADTLCAYASTGTGPIVPRSYLD